MFQIIALIVVIALGAIVASGGTSAIGDVFFSKSADALAQQMASTMSQIETADRGRQAETGSVSATTTPTTVDSSHALFTGEYLGIVPTVPNSIAFGINYSLGTASDATTITAVITSEDVCTEIGTAGALHPKLSCTWGVGIGTVTYNY
ncbi:MAG: hypothetical protein VR70_10935 [Rhodospirillaceae bacterium BRH_c57]|nr:MAG: hypothetical protein VR70_10935 [Rhodospirillaceae bacterium BRH_c57]